MYVYSYAHAAGDPRTWARKLETRSQALRDSSLVSLRGIYTEPDPGDGLELGAAHAVGRGYMFPASWSVRGLFVDLRGDLGLQPIMDGWTQISLRATYSPSDVTNNRDHHLVVETVVKRFLDSITTI